MNRFWRIFISFITASIYILFVIFFPLITIQFNYQLLIISSSIFLFTLRLLTLSDNLTKYVYEFHYLQIVMTQKFFLRASITHFIKCQYNDSFINTSECRNVTRAALTLPGHYYLMRDNIRIIS